jgi:hypothetical protein
MECLIQYLDDIEDFIFGIALTMERIRRLAAISVFYLLSGLVQVSGIYLALNHPAQALALASFLCVGLQISVLKGGFPHPVRHA